MKLKTTGDKAVTFPSQVLKGTLTDLKEIVSRSHGEATESARLISQMEVLVSDIEDKALAAIPVIVPTPTPVI